MRVLQDNLNRSRTTHHLLTQHCSEKQADIVLISKQYQDRAGLGWYADELGTAAIWIRDPRQINVSDQGSGCGYTKLDDLEEALREMQGDLIVARELNAKALELGEARLDSRGRRIMELASRLEISVHYTGSTPTFRRPGYRKTMPDVTLANEQLVARVAEWRIIEDYTGSDHQYILFDVHDRRPAVRSAERPPRWNIARMDRVRLSLVIEGGWRSLQIASASLSPPEQARMIAAATMQLIQKTCAIAVPKKSTKRQRHPVYWWMNEIAELRKKSLRPRRLAQRAKRRDLDAAPLAAEYQAAKKLLKRTINTSPRRVPDRHSQAGDLQTRNSSGREDPGNIVHSLFSSQPKSEISSAASGSIEAPQFTEREILWAASSMRNDRAPGPDGLPTEVMKAVAMTHPELLLNMYNLYLRESNFPAPCKKARLVLISKGKGPADSASSYWPIFMLHL
ncbi:uncharacterized protein LOC124427498 [Vespa crabro]|uniref:uncharacterized protein LOC124427498 n=1 Tax=Vespa crabro TaxID=7445 RepID=UPI001F02F5C1|nr:uncharacterized protein LOC124427498 [Vespa crabro]